MVGNGIPHDLTSSASTKINTSRDDDLQDLYPQKFYSIRLHGMDYGAIKNLLLKSLLEPFIVKRVKILMACKH